VPEEIASFDDANDEFESELVHRIDVHIVEGLKINY
jgi:hypothetical protein